MRENEERHEMAVNHYSKILLMVKAQIEALGLDGLRSGMVEVVKAWRPSDNAGDQAMPLTTTSGILIATGAEKHGNGNNEQWEVNYPAVLVLGRGSGGGRDENLDKIALWRQEIHRAFDFRREPLEKYLEDSEVIKDICRVMYDPGWLEDTWKRHWDANMMVVWTTVFIQRFD